MSDEEAVVVDPRDSAITDFRTAHNDALLDTGHVDHTRRAAELKQMYERRFAAEPSPQYDPVVGQVKPQDGVDEVAAEEMQPLAAEEFEIGENSDFGLQVDKAQYGWDSQLEAEARQTFANAALNNAQARTVATTYYETMLPSFNPDTAARQSAELLKNQYGDQAVQRAIDGTNRMLKQLAGPQMYSYIARSGLGNHPRFVGEACRVARQRGWWR